MLSLPRLVRTPVVGIYNVRWKTDSYLASESRNDSLLIFTARPMSFLMLYGWHKWLRIKNGSAIINAILERGQGKRMELAANIIGIIAVALYIISYQMKTRNGIMLCNATCRVFYILQYIILGAYSGAVLDVLGIAITYLASKKPFFEKKKILPLVIVLSNAAVLIACLVSYQNIFSIFSMLGVAFQINAFWPKAEKKIRLISLGGCPCWLIYNFTSHAYGSCIGDIITFISILTAILRYDIMKKEKA